ncbi:ABC transporter permease [Macrococcoides caseolyticum]|uniref:ABC transporter permease n=1 Tax=Macrococcoides caseolyticum TaxID=69966 RepID=UPI00106091D6|nr:ABC transporter permease [Macrococcus caseolyticus]TDM28778.1 ABC transporter permease [Macrococcus caseolyticus]VUC64614.1 sodium ABC transporter permease [Macrococcus caseolyticus]
MNKFLKTFLLTYKSKVKSKSFIIITLLLVILAGLSFKIDDIMKIFEEKKSYVVISENKEIYQIIKNSYTSLDKNLKIQGASDLSKAKKAVINDKYEILLDIKLNGNKLIGEIYSKKAITTEDITTLQNILSPIQQNISAQSLHISDESLRVLEEKSVIKTNQLKSADKKGLNQKEQLFNQLLSYILMTLLVFIIINYVNQIAIDVANEKTSRVIEMVITSISPKSHILAKIFGIISVALTQVMILLASIFIFYSIFDGKSLLKKFDLTFTSHTWNHVLIALIMWILGIVSYIILAAIVGASVSRIEDVSQAMMPVSILLLGSFYLVLFNLQNPDANIIKVASYIPYLSPFALLLRMNGNELTSIEILISILLNISIIVFTLYFAAVTYKNSVLTFNKNKLKWFKRKKVS